MSITLKSGEAYVAYSESSYPNFDYSAAMPGGGVQVLQFRGAMFVTESEIIANVLEAERKAPQCEWLTKSEVITKDKLDPLYKLREQIRQEELAKLKKAAETNSTSTNSGGGLMTSASMSEKAVGAAVAKAAATPAAKS